MSSPPLILISGCKICKLLKHDRDLWVDFHHRILEKRHRTSEVRAWVNSRIRGLNLSLPEDEQLRPLSDANIYTHFGRHVRDAEDLEKIMDWEGTVEDLFVRRRLRKVLGRSPGLAHLPTNEQILRQHSDLGDHRRSQELILSVERRLQEFDTRLKKKEADEIEKNDVQFALSLDEIAAYQKLVAGLIKLKKEHVATQKSAKIVGEAMEEVVERIVESVLMKVSEVALEIHSTLNRELPGSRLADQMSELVRVRIGSELKTAIPQVLQTTERKFGIK